MLTPPGGNRVNWLVRQLRDSKPEVCIETITLRQRGKGTVRKLGELREAPKLPSMIPPGKSARSPSRCRPTPEPDVAKAAAPSWLQFWKASKLLR